MGITCPSKSAKGELNSLRRIISDLTNLIYDQVKSFYSLNESRMRAVKSNICIEKEESRVEFDKIALVLDYLTLRFL